MQFNSILFIIFLILGSSVLFFLNSKYTKYILLLLNIIFYSYSGLNNLFIILAIAVISFYFSFVLHRKKNKKILFLTIFLTLLPLLFYKYMHFFTNSIMHLDINCTMTKHIPLGISFFTLQIIGYLIDIYKNKYNPEPQLINYLIFVSLFPIVVSGPIERGDSLLPQIRRLNAVKFDYKRVSEGCRLLLFGYLLKVLISERLAYIISIVYSDVNSSSGLILLVTTFLFTIQIYCDFCGYTYIALGAAKIIGLELTQNFNKPYISQSLTEFWTRWHIALSSWLKDYIYIPLGGNRCSKLRNYINVFIVFLISGLWHGANWTYIVWGGLNGLILIFERIVGLNRNKVNKFRKILSVGFTFLTVNFLWIFFRANTISDAILIIKKIIFESFSDLSNLTSISSIIQFLRNMNLSILYCLIAGIGILIFCIYSFCMRKYNLPDEIINCKLLVFRWAIYIGIIFLILTLGSTVGQNQFIYANF